MSGRVPALFAGALRDGDGWFGGQPPVPCFRGLHRAPFSGGCRSCDGKPRAQFAVPLSEELTVQEDIRRSLVAKLHVAKGMVFLTTASIFPSPLAACTGMPMLAWTTFQSQPAEAEPTIKHEDTLIPAPAPSFHANCSGRGSAATKRSRRSRT